MSRGENIVEYLVDMAATIYVDDEYGRAHRIAPQLENLPPDVSGNPELMAKLERIALAVAASEFSRAGFHLKKPSRVDEQAVKAMQAIRRPELLHRLYANLGKQQAQELFVLLSKGLDGDRPTLDSTTLAGAVADTLRSYRLQTNTSKTGFLVQILKSIGEATGMKTNAESAARAALITPSE
ncbi:hypothetical protein R0135_00540 [Congregibacter variabilis]|uniref:Uncharacterized protein n=1 Tax=Congregibacter variabilis TaxID=3081200 RepID=A0ABZ0I3A8_9GAMM|nr:hypothetical protein R0135_00540 [Congregibacter sp. IMCC43200]